VIAARRAYSISLPNGSTLNLGPRTLVMGILNVTPDSFAESTPLLDPGQAIEVGLQMAADGADLIDIGGESTRPGAEPVDAAREVERILPVVQGLAGRLGVPISIDTSKSEVADEAVRAGATMINDVTGLAADPRIAGVAAVSRCALVLMHMRGRPQTMYAEAAYEDLMRDVSRELAASVTAAVRAGVARERLIADPGIGFAKHAGHSYGVLARLTELTTALDLPLLVGPSRKSFMREALQGRAPAGRDWGTAAAVTAAVLAGAHIVRVHAVAEMVQVVRVADEIRRHAADARA
jgi:dihydropteroate synthase